MTDPTAPLPPVDPRPPADEQPSRLRGRLAAVGITGLVVGAAALGLTGVASAGTPTISPSTPAAVADDGVIEAEPLDEGEWNEDDWEEAELAEFDLELSPEDEAVFERFDQCLADNGVPLEGDYGDLDESELENLTEGEWDALEAKWDAEWEAMEETFIAAEEACEPILDELSADAVAAFEELELEHCDEGYDAEEYDDLDDGVEVEELDEDDEGDDA
ncbi:MAG: hypothetical protein AAF962_09270 [Actinomycetota bacterium]